MASKEIYLGKYYLKKKKWVAAINRFKNILEKYETTIYVEEALHRLVETYYIIGLMSGTSMDGIDASFVKSNGITLERFGINCYENYSKKTSKPFF